ncbi:MAG: hypothetical protein RKR03_14710 [Candidatus Competibacter sp.]|nr:hypothetical protein [Candidatus Competibacter sp.]
MRAPGRFVRHRLFDQRLEEAAPSAGQWVAATDPAWFRAVEFLARVEAGGGAEIVPIQDGVCGDVPPPPAAAGNPVLLTLRAST